MAREKKIFKKEILEAAVEVLRQRGLTGLSVRAIAAQMRCSTQPIYDEFKDVKELKEELKEFAREKYRYLAARFRSAAGSKIYKSYGMAYLTFAREEPELFKYLYLSPRKPKEQVKEEVNYEQIIETMIIEYGFTRRAAEDFHTMMSLFCYSIGVMIATGYQSFSDSDLDYLLDKEFMILLKGLK